MTMACLGNDIINQDLQISYNNVQLHLLPN
jgi:hypothetical protein